MLPLADVSAAAMAVAAADDVDIVDHAAVLVLRCVDSAAVAVDDDELEQRFDASISNLA